MNYSLEDLPDSGSAPVIFFDIDLANKDMGRLVFRLDRKVFPAGVENLVRIAEGNTHRIVVEPHVKLPGEQVVRRQTGIVKQVRRTYEGCEFFRVVYNNYLVTGDIYRNDGTSSGTVFLDQPIPADMTDYYYPHEKFGQISLVPYRDEEGVLFYDSTFMVTLDDKKSSNDLSSLDPDQIVVGILIEGHDILRKINGSFRPYAGRTYPKYRITGCGTSAKHCTGARSTIKPRFTARFILPPRPSLLLAESEVEDTRRGVDEAGTEINGTCSTCLGNSTRG